MLRCKVAVVGDATVGKTALLQVLKSTGHDYPKNYVMVSDAAWLHGRPVRVTHKACGGQTSGVDLCIKSIPIPDSNVVVELYLFDCAGQSIFNQREFGTVHVRCCIDPMFSLRT